MSVCQCEELRSAHSRGPSRIVTPNLIPGHFARTCRKRAADRAPADDAHPTA